MFLHLGNNFLIKKNRIIAILDLEKAANSQASKNLLEKAFKHSKVQKTSQEGKVKSIVISDDGLYISPISSSTLCKRSAKPIDF